MKKKVKRKISSHEKKTLLFGIVTFFALALLFGAFSFSTDSQGVITGNALSLGELSIGSFNPFDIWSGGEVINENLVRWLMFFMVLMLVYWATDNLIEGKGFFKLLFAGAISYLAVNFIVIADIYSIMTTYSALGVTFTLIIPFIIVLLFTTKLVSSGLLTVGKVFTERVVWATYSIFVVYYLVTSEKSSTLMNWIILGIMIVSISIAIFNSRFIKFVRRVASKVREANQKTKMTEAKMAAAESTHREELNKVINNLQKEGNLRKQLEKDIDDATKPE